MTDDTSRSASSRWIVSPATLLIAGLIAVLITAMVAVAARIGREARQGGWASSGLHELIRDETVLSRAGAVQGITQGFHSASSQGGGDRAEAETRCEVRIASGTRATLMAAYRDELKREIEARGGTAYDSGSSEQSGGLRDFSVTYRWRGNQGNVRVWSFDGAEDRIEIVSLCLEWRDE